MEVIIREDLSDELVKKHGYCITRLGTRLITKWERCILEFNEGN